MNDEQIQPDAPPQPVRRPLRSATTIFLIFKTLVILALIFVVYPRYVDQKLINELKREGVTLGNTDADNKSFTFHSGQGWIRLDPVPNFYAGPFIRIDPGRGGVTRMLHQLQMISERDSELQTVDDDLLWWVSECPELQVFIHGTSFPDSIWRTAGQWKKLGAIKANAAKFTGEFLSYLNADQIKSMTFTAARTNKAWAARLPAFGGLSIVEFIDSEIDAATLRELLNNPAAPRLKLTNSTAAWPDPADVADSATATLLFWKSRIDRSTLATISRLPRLNTLILDNCDLEASDIQELSNSKSLARFFAAESNINDDSLAMIGRITSLVELRINGADVSGRGIGHLAGMPKLELLEIDDTKADDAAAEHLVKIGSLRTLSMINTAIGDAGFELLIKQGKLKSLDVTGAKVTSKGLEVLFEKRTLEELSLNDSILTDEIREKIKAANPELKISTKDDAPAEPSP